MKKILIITLLIIIALNIGSCKSSREFRVVEAGEFDRSSPANHSAEISLIDEDYKKESVADKKVKINNMDINGTYKNSKKGYLFNSDQDVYEYKKDNIYIQFAVDNDTGMVSRYSDMSMDYLQTKGDAEQLTQEQCVEVAAEYLKRYIDIGEYSLLQADYLKIPEYTAIYNLEYVKLIDGIKTSDKVYIGVTVYGDVIMHLFGTVDAVNDKAVPTDEEFQKIDEKINEKIDGIYSSIKDKYAYSYQVEDKVLVRLSDGSYAMEYELTVDLKSLNSSSADIAEFVKLLVYFE